MASPAVIVGEERYVFDTEFYDTQADILRYYRITYYPGDSSIEMVSYVIVENEIIIHYLWVLHWVSNVVLIVR